MMGDRRAAITLTLILCLVMVIVPDIKIVKAVYIRSDGSVDGLGIQRDGSIYTLTGPIDRIVMEKSNAMIDGNGYSLTGASVAGSGVYLRNVENVWIKNLTIQGFVIGILVEGCSSITILDNTITESDASFPPTGGIMIHRSSSNNIIGNEISNNHIGIYLGRSSNSRIFHNIITNNEYQIEDPSWDFDYNPPSINIWDNGMEGNYWSDYKGTDSDGDGIGDTPYVIDENNQDNYPLMYYGVPPTISVVSPENRTYNVNNVTLAFAVSEPTSWIGYSLDGQTIVRIGGNTTITELSPGSHNLIVYAKDTAGNTGTSETIDFRIEPQQSESFPTTWILFFIGIIAIVGVAIPVFFIKTKKTRGEVK